MPDDEVRVVPEGSLRPITLVEDHERAFTFPRIALLRRWGPEVYDKMTPSPEDLDKAETAARDGQPIGLSQDVRIFKIMDADQHVGDITLALGHGDEGQPELDVSIFDGFSSLEGCHQHYASRAIDAAVDLAVPEYGSVQAVVLGTNPNMPSVERILKRCKFRWAGDRWLIP